MDNLYQLYSAHNGNVSDKWRSNIDFYDEIFAARRADPVRLLPTSTLAG